jgi:hypothetical protein
MPWTSTQGGTWEDKFRLTKEICEHSIRELDKNLNESKTPKQSLPQDWAKREAVVYILNRMEEIEEEELGDPVEILSKRFDCFADVIVDGIKRTLAEQHPPKPKKPVLGLNDLEPEPNDVLTRKTEFILQQWVGLAGRVDKLEETLKQVKRAFEQE